MTARVPFTILTGWLGAGKTTALNRLLAAASGRRIAVLVNELGRISIDTQLIVGRGGDVLELAGGCVCCKVDIKNDLWDGIRDIVARNAPDHVVLETTGIAEPAAILDSLAGRPRRLTSDAIGERTNEDADGDIAAELPAEAIDAKRAAEQRAASERIEAVGVVCVVDAEHGGDPLRTRDEAREQAACADRILLTKLDRATPDAVRATHGELDAIAPAAERASFPPGGRGDRELADWLLERRSLRAWRSRPHAHAQGDRVRDVHAHEHGGQLVAVTFADDAPLVAERVLAVLDALGPRLVRAKGFVHLAGEPRRGFVERAGVRTELVTREPWGDAPKQSEIVLIGDDLDEPSLRRALWACRAEG